MIGYLTCGMKNVQEAFLGDTFFEAGWKGERLESFSPLKSMVFAGVYPVEPAGFSGLEEAVRRVRSSSFLLALAPRSLDWHGADADATTQLTLTDRSVTSNRESSSFLGQGFRLGFNGSLHMDVFRQRLEDEFGEEVIVTRPLVPVKSPSFLYSSFHPSSSILSALTLFCRPRCSV